MLNLCRNLAKNIFFKSFLFVLACLFVFWSVGDIFRNNNSRYVAKVADEKISADLFNSRLRQEIAQIERNYGTTLNEEQIKSLQIDKMLLRDMISQAMIQDQISSLNINVDDKLVGKFVKRDPNFFDENGKFSRKHFEELLNAAGISEAKFVDNKRKDIAQNYILGSLINEEQLVYVSQLDKIAKHRMDKILVDVIKIPPQVVKESKNPSETDLIQFYQENKEKFKSPELRKISYLTFNYSDVASEIKITEQDIKTAYQERLAEFTVGETRKVTQYLFDGEADAKKASAEIAKDSEKYKNKKMDLGTIEKGKTLPEIDDAIFALKKKVYSNPVKSSLGWHIFIVEDIYPAHTKKFDEVKQQLSLGLENEKKSKDFYAFASKIEDEIASAASMESIAKKYNFNIKTIDSIDKTGHNNSGSLVKDIPEPELFINLAFAQNSGSESPLTLLSDNNTYLLLRVDSISKERIKALDEARGVALNLMNKEFQARAHKAYADNIYNNLKKNSAIQDSVKKDGVITLKSQNFTRPSANKYEDSAKSDYPYELRKEVFSLTKSGSFTSPYLDKDGNYLIASFVKKQEASEGEIAEARLKLKEEMANNISDDISNSYIQYLEQLYPVKIYYKTETEKK